MVDTKHFIAAGICLLGIILGIAAAGSNMWRMVVIDGNTDEIVGNSNGDPSIAFIGPFGGCISGGVFDHTDDSLICKESLKEFFSLLLCYAEDFHIKSGIPTTTDCGIASTNLSSYPDSALAQAQATIVLSVLFGIAALLCMVFAGIGWSGLTVAGPFLRFHFLGIVFSILAATLISGSENLFNRSRAVMTAESVAQGVLGVPFSSHGASAATGAAAVFAGAAVMLIISGEKGQELSDTHRQSRSALAMVMLVVGVLMTLVAAASTARDVFHGQSLVLSTQTKQVPQKLDFDIGPFGGCYPKEKINAKEGTFTVEKVCEGDLKTFIEDVYCEYQTMNFNDDNYNNDQPSNTDDQAAYKQCLKSDLVQNAEKKFPDPSLSTARAFLILSIIVGASSAALAIAHSCLTRIPVSLIVVGLSSVASGLAAGVHVSLRSSPFYQIAIDSFVGAQIDYGTFIRQGPAHDACTAAVVSFAIAAALVYMYPLNIEETSGHHQEGDVEGIAIDQESDAPYKPMDN